VAILVVRGLFIGFGLRWFSNLVMPCRWASEGLQSSRRVRRKCGKSICIASARGNRECKKEFEHISLNHLDRP
jgi:hypothetical protein